MNGICRLFLAVADMSVTAGFVILLVLAGRWFLRKAPRRFAYFLWIIVGFRLVCPFSFSSAVSMFNLEIFRYFSFNEMTAGKEVNAGGEVGSAEESVFAGVPDAADGAGDAGLSGTGEFADTTREGKRLETAGGAGITAKGREASAALSVDGAGRYTRFFASIWLVGVVVFLIGQIAAFQRLRRNVAFAVQFKKDIYECENISIPFVMGFFRPVIYLPSGIAESDREYILLHEQYHIRRRDHQVKALSMVLLAVYWFHPLVWLSYRLMCRDMEMSCDEKVIQTLGSGAKEGYSRVLLSLSASTPEKKGGGACQPAFGGTSVKRRIRNILDFKSPKKQAVVLGTAVCILIILVGMGNGQDRGSQIRCVKQPGKGNIEYEYRLDRKIKSFLVYKEYYQDGELREYRTLRAGDLAEAGVGREGKFVLQVERNSQSLESGWNINFLHQFEGEADFSRDMNTWASLNYGYLGMMESYFLENQSSWQKLEAGQDLTLAAWHLMGSGRQGFRKIPCQDFMDVQTKRQSVGQNSGEILYYLVFSEESAKELEKEYLVSPYARILFEAANPYVGDASADGKLLKVLGIFSDMKATMELETSAEPYVLRLHFEDQPEDEFLFHEQMEKNAVLLLCLIENADRIEWTYSADLPEGHMERRFYCDREKAADLLGAEDIRQFAESEEELQELLTGILPDIYPEYGTNVVGLGVGEGRYASPKGDVYKYLKYFIGRLPGEEFDEVFRTLTDAEEITADDVAEAISEGGTSKKLYLIQEGRRISE